jgi:hypothetical protein
MVDEDGAILTCREGKGGQLRHRTAQDRLLPMQLGREAFGFSPRQRVSAINLSGYKKLTTDITLLPDYNKLDLARSHA